MSGSENKINKSLFYLFIGVGIFLRTFKLGENPLWADEAFTQYWSKSIIEGEWKWLWEIDFNPPLYYIAQSPFSYFLSDFFSNEISARIPSLIFEFIFIFLAYKFLKSKTKNNFPQTFLMLWMVSPAAIEAARTGRGYTLLLLFSFLAWRKIKRVLETTDIKKNMQTTDIKNKIIFMISTTGMLYTHYYGFLILGGLFLYSFSIKKTKAFLVSLIPTILLFLPWLPKFLIQLNRGNEMIQDLTPTRIPRGLISIFTGQTIFLENFGMANKDLLLCIFITALMSFFVLKSLKKKNKLFIFEALSIPLMAMIFSIFGLEIWEEYWFLPGIPATIILLIKGLEKIPRRKPNYFYPLVLALSYVSLQISYYSHQEWNIVKGVGNQTVLANTPFDIYPLKFVLKGRSQKDYQLTYSHYENEKKYGSIIGKKTCIESQKTGKSLFVSGSFDPVPSGGIIENLKECQNLKLIKEKIGRRVFLHEYKNIKNQEK